METIIANELRERCYRASGAYIRFTQEQLDSMKLRISELPRETIEYLGTVTSPDLIKSRDQTYNSMLYHMLAEDASVQQIEDVSLLYSRYAGDLRQDILASLLTDDAIPSLLMRGILNGLQKYDLEGFNYDSQKPIRTHDAKTIQQCVTLSVVAHGLRTAKRLPVMSADGDFVYIEDKGFAQLVVENVDETSRLLELVSDRGMDAEIIRDILNAPSAALSEGTL